MKEIKVDPITRLEGHGNISIFLNEQGEVENAYLKIPEFRGFEAFCVGRRAVLMPILTTRICGVCPVAHNAAHWCIPSRESIITDTFGFRWALRALRLRLEVPTYTEAPSNRYHTETTWIEPSLLQVESAAI